VSETCDVPLHCWQVHIGFDIDPLFRAPNSAESIEARHGISKHSLARTRFGQEFFDSFVLRGRDISQRLAARDSVWR